MKRIAQILLVLAVVVLSLAAWKRDEIKRLLAVNSLFAPDRIVTNFSNMDRAFLTAPIGDAAGQPSELSKGPTAKLPREVEAWITDRSVTSLVVLKDGKIVTDAYFQDTGPDDLRINWSVSKSYLSALLGIVIDQGLVASIDDPVVTYAPELAESAYADATIKNVLQMSSGVAFNEDYLDQSSDINRMGRVLALGRSMDGFTTALTDQTAQPGDRWQYVSIDTHVIGMIIRGATGRPIAELLAEYIITPLGFEQRPYMLTDGYGVSFVLGGLNSTTRDNARFGQMIAQNGMWDGKQIVPADWIAESTRASAKTEADQFGYGYQWWIPVGARDGQFMARGIYGQYIYIDQTRNVVIATHGADRQFRAEGAADQNLATFRAIAESLD